jgi:hypothetical protein
VSVLNPHGPAEGNNSERSNAHKRSKAVEKVVSNVFIWLLLVVEGLVFSFILSLVSSRPNPKNGFVLLMISSQGCLDFISSYVTSSK